MKCDQCEMLSINGVACHETGCPNSRKSWVNGEWVMLYECPECGTEHTDTDALAACCAPEVPTADDIEKNLKALKPKFYALLRSLKADIHDDYRASDDPDDKLPGMCVTIACNDDATSWSYQTGDNSFTGGAYGLPHWAIVYLYRRSNCKALAKEVCEQLADLILS